MFARRRACELWPEVLKAASRYGMRVGSPAANHCRPGGGGLQDSNCFQAPMDWFDEFFAQPGCGLDTVDFIATHKYGCNATDTIQYVMELHNRYHKPIWLTEFSCSKAPVRARPAASRGPRTHAPPAQPFSRGLVLTGRARRCPSTWLS